MLIKCPECNLDLSDKAFACPHCGYPMKTSSNNHARRKPKHMRLPNGFGQISEIKGRKLRKPFRAMVTIGKTDEGKPICKMLQPVSYFETYNDAYKALMEYNKNPYVFNNDATVQELFESWSKQYFRTCSESSKNSVRTVWRYCDSIKNIKVIEIRPRHLRYCMEEGCVTVKGVKKTASAGIKTKMKSMFNMMFDYALEYELVEQNYSRTISISKADIKEAEAGVEHHIPYTDEEIKKLWQNINMPGADVILIQCYTGWRPQELELLLLENINLEEWTMTGGVKTKSGINRVVPIHTRIRPLVEARYNASLSAGSKYLFTNINPVHSNTENKVSYTYRRFHTDLKNIIERLGFNPDHKPHDGRHHFVTMAKKYNVDEYAIKRIAGHKIKDITEAVYTTRDVSWLRNEIEKIK